MWWVTGTTSRSSSPAMCFEDQTTPVSDSRARAKGPGASRNLRLGGSNILRNAPASLSTLQEIAASPIVRSPTSTCNLRPDRCLLRPQRHRTPRPQLRAMRRHSTLWTRRTSCRTSWTITRARQLRGQELVESRPRICLAVTDTLSRKECERAAGSSRLPSQRCSRRGRK